MAPAASVNTTGGRARASAFVLTPPSSPDSNCRPMKTFLTSLAAAALLAISTSAHAEPEYKFVPDFLKPPAGKETIGNGHGEIAVDAAGNIYVSVQDQKDEGLQVYSPDGKFMHNLKAPPTLHGFVIRKDPADGNEYIYAAVLGEARVLKMKLDGTVVLEIPTASFPFDQAKVEITHEGGKTAGLVVKETPQEVTLKGADGKEQTVKKAKGDKRSGGLKLTNCDVGPNGDIYVVDGYGASWIFQFDKDGKFKKVFGGPVAPWKLANCHKIFVDNRFQPARLFLCDRGNNRIMHLTLDGDIIGVIADHGLRRPSSASFHGDLVCVAEIAGRVSVWNKDGKMVKELGVNDTQGQTNTPKVEPKDWREGVVTSPHGITFDAKGDIMETEWNQWGRVLRWDVK